jgi:membrane-bound lytic murein transglycosylase F
LLEQSNENIIAQKNYEFTVASSFREIMRSRTGRLPGLILLGIIFLLGLSCDQPFFKNDLEAIRARGELRVITSNNATCYFEGPNGPTGFEYQLAESFAGQLGVKLKLVIIDNEKEMISALLSGQADLIAAGFPVKDHLRGRLAFGPSYLKIDEQVIGRRGGPCPKSVCDLMQGPLWIIADSFQEEILKDLKKSYPELSWMKLSDYGAEECLEMVWQRIIPLTIADSNIIAMNRRYYPDLLVHFAVKKNQNVAWVMHPQTRHLRAAVRRWFDLSSTQTLIEGLIQHYYGHLEAFDYVDLKKYHERLAHRLPMYQKHFEKAAKDNGLDWRMVAAQAYQESHWNPNAKSFTGVRGLMMLTLETAGDLGVENRLDPEQSIYAGAVYLAGLHRRIGNEVPEPDRTFMALAAYNIGWGHLEDTRTLAARLNKNPNAWYAVRSTLPLLHKKKYYKTLPNGYARGLEAVQYVDHVRTYYRILVLNVEKSQKKSTALNRSPIH